MTAKYLLLAFPLLWLWFAKIKLHQTITWSEWGVNLVISALLVLGVYQAGLYSQTADTEIWNGEVTGKKKEWVSCEHSYSCNCREVCSGSGSSRSCSTTCDTCYEHSNDWDWNVYSNIGAVTIDRIDRRGSNEPPRWSQVNKGEPVSLEKSFTNYIKGVGDSLFHDEAPISEAHMKLIPAYPENVYDYYRLNHVLTSGVPVKDLKQWNADMAEALKAIGPRKEANVVLLLVNTADQMFRHSLERAWLGGKKNDIIVLIGSTDYPKIDWVDVVSWTKQELFKVELRDAIYALGIADREKVVGVIKEHTMKSFNRRDWHDFDYLQGEVEPPFVALVIAVLLSILAPLGLSYLSHRTDFFEFGGKLRRKRF